MAVCRKFELDLGDKGLIYNLFVQPSVFFRQALKTDGCASRSVCRTLNGPAPCESGADSLRRSLFDFEAITTGQLVQTPDQVQAFTRRYFQLIQFHPDRFVQTIALLPH
jgi:hypothetical protein